MFLLKFRRGLKAEWHVRNPILADGEPGFETDTGKFKVGDGVKAWRSLEYFVPGAGSPGIDEATFLQHVESPTPHPAYDELPSLLLLYQNAKV